VPEYRADLLRDIGKRYSTACLESYSARTDRQRAVLGAACDIATAIEARQQVPNLILFGPPGTGKDHLVIGLLRKDVESESRAKYMSWPVVMAGLRNAASQGRAEEPVIKEAWQAPFLGLSELVSPRRELSGYNAEILLRIIDERYRREYPTFVTANAASIDDLRTKLTEPVADRLFDGAVVAHMNWRSDRDGFRVV
jgi:DNA replication protein DnaC